MNTDTSSAYQAGQIVGMLFMGLLSLAVLAFFIVALVRAFTKKTKGWIFTAVIMGVLGLFIVVGSAGVAVKMISSAISKSAQSTQVLTSKDGAHRISAPSSWKNM